jgi:purine-binding chemotaxis protein CheW
VSPGATAGRRAGDAKRPSAAAFPEEPVLVMEIAGTVLGLSLARVREVAQVGPVTRIPFAPPFVTGITVVRGRLVPLIDGARFLLGNGEVRGERIVVLDVGTGDESLAFRVDAARGVIDLARTETRPPPPEASSALPQGLAARVALPADRRLVTVLDADRLVALALARLRPRRDPETSTERE